MITYHLVENLICIVSGTRAASYPPSHFQWPAEAYEGKIFKSESFLTVSQ